MQNIEGTQNISSVMNDGQIITEKLIALNLKASNIVSTAIKSDNINASSITISDNIYLPDIGKVMVGDIPLATLVNNLNDKIYELEKRVLR